MTITLIPLDEFPGYYAGSDGFVHSEIYKRTQWDREIIASPRPMSPGKGHRCLFVSLLDATNTKQTRKLHRLICSAFNGPCPVGLECSHLDGKFTNNLPTNLVWETHQENIARKTAHGTNPQGSNNPHAVLNDVQVLLIKEIITQRLYTHEMIGFMFGVSRSQISCIARGVSWSHVGPDVSKILPADALLSYEDVSIVKSRLLKGTESKVSLSKEFGVPVQTIGQIYRNKAFAYIEPVLPTPGKKFTFLTKEEVSTVKEDLLLAKETLTELAKKYNKTPSTILAIFKGVSHKHILPVISSELIIKGYRNDK